MGPLPGPADVNWSSSRRPHANGALTTSKALPHGSTLGSVGRSAHRAWTLRGNRLAEASQSAPAGVTESEWEKRAGSVCLLMSTDSPTRRILCGESPETRT
ncbi:hypothetical protein AN216_15530 [Streptomyces oceani]|uniref:Uncharacterized protein n=1 Tax=Streptomyces oceani TaxID=1075402 RepID=A0A1E7KFW8_9ACTN|nr:hypothetical protein AN216_15530 [Streptomyces oceani]